MITYTNNAEELSKLNINLIYATLDGTLYVNGNKYSSTPPLPDNAVDLGLPSGRLWAKCNVGATTETEYGDYFMWGSIVPNTDSDCSWVNTPFNNGSWKFDQEYFDSVKDSVCPNGILAPEYDAVRQIMGGNWRMPTKEDFEELLSGTTSAWVANYNDSGINGRLFTSKINENSIFIPASGGRDGISFYNDRIAAYVHSSELFTEDAWLESSAWYLGFSSDDCIINNNYRYKGNCLRGVK